MSAHATERVIDPWWFPVDEPAPPRRPAPDTVTSATTTDGRSTVRLAPAAGPDDLRRVVSLAAARGPCHTVVLDLSRIPDDAALARAVAAARVRLLVRGLRVELVGAPAAVLAAVGPDAPDRYRVIDGPTPRRRTGFRRPTPRGHRDGPGASAGGPGRQDHGARGTFGEASGGATTLTPHEPPP